jgi:hypothetical protein
VEDDALYHASSSSIIRLIADADNKYDSLMIFGANWIDNSQFIK